MMHTRLDVSRSVHGLFLLLVVHNSFSHASVTVFPGKSNYSDPSHKHFMVIIPSYNNKEWYLWNLRSILDQDYDNFEIIYLDDCSCDGTADLVEDFLRTQQLSCTVTLIRNSRKDGPAANRYRAIHRCSDTSIMVFVDGDDALAHNQVLSYLNTVYQDEDIWFTYGQHQHYPTAQQGWASQVPGWVVQYTFFRHYGWVFSHLRTAYAWLGKQVKLVDLLHEGVFVPMATDIALFYPMIEMAGTHIRYIDQVLYLYNRATSLNMHTLDPGQQRSFDKIIRQRTAYKPLEYPVFESLGPDDLKTPLLILSCGNVAAIEKLIKDAQDYLIHHNDIHVLYHTHNRVLHASYQELKQKYQIQCVNLLNKVYDETLAYLHNLNASYVILADDTSSITIPIDSFRCVQALEKTKAYSMHITKTLSAQPPLPAKYNSVDDDIYAWQFAYGDKEWYQANSFDIALYRKDTLCTQWRMIPFTSLAYLKQTWQALHMPGHLGLFLLFSGNT